MAPLAVKSSWGGSSRVSFEYHNIDVDMGLFWVNERRELAIGLVYFIEELLHGDMNREDLIEFVTGAL